MSPIFSAAFLAGGSLLEYSRESIKVISNSQWGYSTRRVEWVFTANMRRCADIQQADREVLASVLGWPASRR